MHVPRGVKLTAQMIANYEPKQDQIIFRSGQMIQRVLFYQWPSQWDTVERTHIDGFNQYLMDEQKRLPLDFPEQEIVRSLHGAAWNYRQTYLDIQAQILWRQTNLPLHIEEIETKFLVSFTFYHSSEIRVSHCLRARQMVPPYFANEANNLTQGNHFNAGATGQGMQLHNVLSKRAYVYSR